MPSESEAEDQRAERYASSGSRSASTHRLFAARTSNPDEHGGGAAEADASSRVIPSPATRIKAGAERQRGV